MHDYLHRILHYTGLITTLAACGGHVAKQPSDGALCRLMQIIINTIDTSGLLYAKNQLDPYCRYDRTAEL